MINVYCSLVSKDWIGKIRTFVRFTSWLKKKRIWRKIPVTTVYQTYNSHRPRCARGCGAEDIANRIYWDKDLNPVLNIRIEYHLTWYSADSVPKNVITLHKKALTKWIEKEAVKVAS